MANPRQQKDIEFNDGTYYHMGQYNTELDTTDCGVLNAYGSYSNLPSVVCFDRYTSPSTFISLALYASNAIANKFTGYNLHAYEVDDRLELGGQHWHDISWYNFKEDLNNSVQWLWGDLEGGGLGIFTTDLDYNSGVYFIATYGVYCDGYDDETKNEKICSFVSNTPFSISQLSACCISYVYDVARDNLDAYYNCIYFANLTSATAYKYGSYDPINNLYVYIEGTITDFSEVLTNSYKSILGTRWLPDMCFFRNDLSYVGSNSIMAPLEKELHVSGYFLDHGSIDDSDTYNPNANGGITDPEEPDGGFENHTDDIDFTDAEGFANDAVSSGFVTLYNPNQANIQAFTDFLFTGITESVSNVLKRLISSPLDYVIGMNVVHFTPRQKTASQNIKFCGIDSGVSAPTLYQFKTIDCGSVDINEQFNTFLDYGGFSKCKLVLPYCGVYPLEINEIMSSTMTIKYEIDQLTGACVAQVRIKRKIRSHVTNDPSLDSVLYEYTGNVFSAVPLSAIDYRGTIQGLMQIASGASQVATGSAAGLGQVASGVMNLTPHVQHSGNMSTSYGYLGRQKPVLILERPMQALANEFGTREGFVSNIYINKLSNLTGYNEIDINSFKTEYLKCTDAEREELIKILDGGFII